MDMLNSLQTVFAAVIDYSVSVFKTQQSYTYPGRGIDMDEDYEDWSIQDLRDRVRLVQELDALADEMVQQAVQMAKDYSVEEVEILVPQTRVVLVPNC